MGPAHVRFLTLHSCKSLQVAKVSFVDCLQTVTGGWSGTCKALILTVW